MKGTTRSKDTLGPAANRANARMVLGLVTGFLYTAASMILEPQDRTGRVGHEGLIDKTGRTELASRIFVPVGHGQAVYSFLKLRKTFAAASVTFNMEESFHDACATKMLSIMQMAIKYPIQAAFDSVQGFRV